MDKPFNFFRPVILPPDPLPVRDPRPEAYEAEDNDDRPTPPPTGTTSDVAGGSL